MMDWILIPASDLGLIAEYSNNTEYKISPRLVDNPAHVYYGYYIVNSAVTEYEYDAYWEDKLSPYTRVHDHPDNLFIPSDV